MSDTDFLIDLQVQIGKLMSLKYDVSRINRVPTRQDATFGDKASLIQAASLFVDIRKSTALLEKFKKSDVANLLKSFHYICSQVIKKNKGEVRSFNGDGVLALFTEESCCDDAVSCAFNIKYCLKLLLISAYKIENNFDFGVGIDYGDLLVVKVGNRGEFNNDLVWIGNSVNRSAKMGSNGKSPDNIIISNAVYKKLSKSNKIKPSRNSQDNLSFILGALRPEVWKKTLSPIPLLVPQEPIIYYSSHERAL
ncbi:MAG: adenylate/guanylate cyclase domain-containing protein [candidate division Zixibacteria bacterium]